ncbi:MAG: Fe-S cluster assembly protein SufD [Gammaproteobacteria bacterium]|nr:Fe-S cluster assembly protein SufD [Gammaproteobacteria bacterium]MBU2677257.1 Fe-S cluster assembly protein SufD [Gammaproteobacteria bacterium]NNC56024.1 Fe-S cluster assembly protein SufD [Woeseiaceae bacterium]NNL50988.1 Fe-S cluster assembly protein SufD [Woeseiaceae bacterium]
MKHAALSIDDLRDVVRRLPDNGLTPSREAALAHFHEHGLPTLRDEDWKYTDLSPVVNISNRWLTAGGPQLPHKSLRDTVDAITRSIDAHWLVIANGTVDDQFVNAITHRGIEVSRFSDAPAPFEMQRPLADLNAALLHDGLRLRITGSTDKPVGILVVDRAKSDAGVAQSCVDIQVEPGVSAEFIEYHVSDGDAEHYANSVLSMVVGERASVRHVRIQNRAIRHVQTSRTSVALGKDARLHMASYDLGGALIRNDLDIDLGKPGADVVFDGLYLAGDGQHIDNHTRVDHRVGPATSTQEYRGILNGNCRCVWNGKAIVHRGADGTDANQANHNLLLSEKAEIDAKPELEIYADDVKCSHGTTVGQLDETALFYLRSRGLDKRHATQVLTHAFAADIVLRSPVTAMTETITAIVEKRLAQLIEADFVSDVLS